MSKVFSQNKEISNIKPFLANLNLIICFVGYPLVTSLFLRGSNAYTDVLEASRAITIPFRAFSLLLSLIVILMNFRGSSIKWTHSLKLFAVFCFLLIIRILYDLNLRADVMVNNTSQLYLYVFAICLPSMVSVMMSYKYIDMEKVLYWIWGLMVITLVIIMLSNRERLIGEATDERQSANIAFNSISFGHFGVSTFILSFFILVKKQGLRYQKMFRIFLICILFLSLFVTLRASSRGPIIALLVVFSLWIFSAPKNSLRGLVIVACVLFLIVLNLNSILSYLAVWSPVMEKRIYSTLQEGDSGRNSLYKNAINTFMDSPFIGKQFAIFNNYGELGYSHNIILDAFMGLGFVGGAIMIYLLLSAIKKSFALIKDNNRHFWFSLLLIQQIVFNMFSGAFYYNQLLWVLFPLIFIYNPHSNKKALKII